TGLRSTAATRRPRRPREPSSTLTGAPRTRPSGAYIPSSRCWTMCARGDVWPGGMPRRGPPARPPAGASPAGRGRRRGGSSHGPVALGSAPQQDRPRSQEDQRGGDLAGVVGEQVDVVADLVDPEDLVVDEGVEHLERAEERRVGKECRP